MSERSTGALTPEEHAAQDKRYEEYGGEYDYVFIGAGNSALTAAALLANKGEKVCLLEAHDTAGGYAHTFTYGDYSWCAQVHYVWGANTGGNFDKLLKKLGLSDTVTFESYDPAGYDMMVMPDGKRVPFPYGFDDLGKNLDEAYPGHKPAIDKFITILKRVYSAFKALPPSGSPLWKYAVLMPKIFWLLLYKHMTLQDVFDKAGLPIELQTVLGAQAGDYGHPPNEISIIPYAALVGGYDKGAYYPTHHYSGYIQALVDTIEKNGGHLYYETRVSKLEVEGSRITEVRTENGKTFTARKSVICNMDPQAAAKHLIGLDKFPKNYLPKLEYPYSPSGMMVYLGLKDIDLEKYGFGKFNIWHFPEWGVNESWNKAKSGDYTNPWFFVSTATMLTDAPGAAPKGHHIMEIAINIDYDDMKKLYETDRKAYLRRKNELADAMIGQVRKYYIPDIDDYIAMKVVGSPVTNERFVNAPRGNAYGASLIPSMMKLGRINAFTPFDNFYWCNATSGGAGLHGTATTGIELYQHITGDKFL